MSKFGGKYRHVRDKSGVNMAIKTKVDVLSETEEAKLFKQWADLQYEIKDKFIHIANERSTSWATGKLLKEMGVRKGVSDYFIPLPKNGLSGLWLELKRTKRYAIQEHQREWLKLMRKFGYAAEFVFGADDAIKITTQYINGSYIARSLEVN